MCWRWLLLISLAVGGSACSRFDRDWKLAMAMPGPSEGLEGPWEGRWKSDAGHGSGKLRCILSRLSEDEYLARFRATFWGILKAGYEVKLKARPRDGGVEIQGEKDLGSLAGGVYRYEGTVSPTNFSATYSSKNDNGTFEMRRP